MDRASALRIWKPIAGSFALVGLVLTVGTVVPLVGINVQAWAEVFLYCNGQMPGPYWHIWLMPSCGPAVPGDEMLGVGGLLGGLAVLTCAFVWVRRRLADPK